VSLCQSRLGEIIRSRYCFPTTATHTTPKPHTHTFTANITSHQPQNLEIATKQHGKMEYMSKPELPYLEMASTRSRP